MKQKSFGKGIKQHEDFLNSGWGDEIRNGNVYTDGHGWGNGNGCGNVNGEGHGCGNGHEGGHGVFGFGFGIGDGDGFTNGKGQDRKK